jgi:hypothetical protein
MEIMQNHIKTFFLFTHILTALYDFFILVVLKLFALNSATCSGISLCLATLFTRCHQHRGMKRFGMRWRCNNIGHDFVDLHHFRTKSRHDF